MIEQVIQWVVMTDLDGTLLHHKTYQAGPAAEKIRTLQDAGIPVIFNTSKTYLETVALQTQYGLQAPFIIESGSCILLPVDQFPERPDGAELREKYWSIQTGISHDRIIRILDMIETPGEFYTRLSDCSPDQVVEMTGLTYDQAKMAKIREYSEPIIWHMDQPSLDVFHKQLSQHQLTINHGGRFIQVLGLSDKGDAAIRLTACYPTKTRIIALGDSANDAMMLDKADIAIAVCSPSNEALMETVTAEILTEKPAPEGWCEGIDKALEIIKRAEE